MKQLILAILLLTNVRFALADEVTCAPQKVFDSSRYVSNGNVFQLDSTYLGFVYRNSGTHGTGTAASAQFRKFEKATRTWDTTPVTIYSDSTKEVGDTVSGVIGSKIYVFFIRRSLAGVLLDLNVVTSTDLTGTSWSGLTTIATFPGLGGTGDAGHVHGALTHVGGNTYMIAWHSHNAARTAYYAGVVWSDDAGATWQFDEDRIYTYPDDGPVKLDEGALAAPGGGRVLGLFRDARGTTNVSQSTSTNSGVTWTDPGADFTNLESDIPPGSGYTGHKIPWVSYISELDKFFAAYEDRSKDNGIKLAFGDVDAVFTDPDNWGEQQQIVNLFASGYPSIAQIDSDEFLITYFKEDVDPSTPSNRDIFDQDAWYFIYKVSDLEEDGGDSCTENGSEENISSSFNGTLCIGACQ